MNKYSSSTSLMDIQRDLARRLRHVDVITDINLSPEDYHILATKVKVLFQFANDNNVVDDYNLAIVVYWVFSMVYWDVDNLSRIEMDQLFVGLPQYKAKYYLEVCMEAFDEYGINRYDLRDTTSISQSRDLIARHAGIPEEERTQVFNIISEYLDCAVVDDVVNQVLISLPSRSRSIFCCYTESDRVKQVMLLRNLMLVCLKGDIPREMLFKRYPEISTGVIDSMLEWCNEYEASVSRLS